VRSIKRILFLGVLSVLLSACSSSPNRDYSIHRNYSDNYISSWRAQHKPFRFYEAELFWDEVPELEPKVVPAAEILLSSVESLDRWEAQQIKERLAKAKKKPLMIVENSWWVMDQQINGAFVLDRNYRSWSEISQIIYGNQFHAESLEIWNASKDLKRETVVYYSSPLSGSRAKVLRLVDEFQITNAQVTISSGDTLSKLAIKHLGDLKRWPEIHQLNSWLYNPNKLEVGQQLTLPFHKLGQRVAEQRKHFERKQLFQSRNNLSKTKYSKQIIKRLIKKKVALEKRAYQKDQIKNPLYKWWKDHGIKATFVNKKSTPAWLSESAFHRRNSIKQRPN
jgi:LysM repeat protein